MSRLVLSLFLLLPHFALPCPLLVLFFSCPVWSFCPCVLLSARLSGCPSARLSAILAQGVLSHRLSERCRSNFSACLCVLSHLDGHFGSYRLCAPTASRRQCGHIIFPAQRHQPNSQDQDSSPTAGEEALASSCRVTCMGIGGCALHGHISTCSGQRP